MSWWRKPKPEPHPRQYYRDLLWPAVKLRQGECPFCHDIKVKLMAIAGDPGIVDPRDMVGPVRTVMEAHAALMADAAKLVPGKLADKVASHGVGTK